VRFFESLARTIESQPWLERDRAMIDPLRTLGIEKGKAFNPDAATREIMTCAAQEARQRLELKYEASLLPPFYEGGHWALPTTPGLIDGMQSSFADANHYPLDGRGTIYAMAFFCPKQSGLGSYYLMATKDNQGRPFDGGSTYRLRVPPNGETVLVGHGLRPRHARSRPRHAPRQSLLAEPCPAGQRGRISGHLLRTHGPREGGVELGADKSRRRIRGALPLLRSGEVALRKADVAVTRYRESLRSAMTAVQNGPQTIDTRIGALEFTHDFANGFPTDATGTKTL
jgi:hypothetical protein